MALKEKIYFFCLVSLLLCTISCAKKESISLSKNKEVSFKKTDFVSFIDSVYNGLSTKMSVYYSKDSAYLFSLDNMYNRLEILNLNSYKASIYNLNTNHFLSKYSFNSEDFYLHNLDSIFIYSRSKNALALIDRKANLINYISLNKATSAYQSDNFLGINSSSPETFFYNDKTKQVLFKTHSPKNIKTNPAYFNKNFMALYDLQKDSFIRSLGNFPDKYKEASTYFLNSHLVSLVPFFDENRYFVSFISDHYVYEYALDTDKLIKTYDAKSNFLDKFKNLSRKHDGQEQINFLRTEGEYSKLLFNPKKRQFYRLVIHNQELRNPKTAKLSNPVFNRSFSVIVFDDKMNKLKEIVCKNPTDYTFFNIACHEKGLMLIYKNTDDDNQIKMDIMAL